MAHRIGQRDRLWKPGCKVCSGDGFAPAPPEIRGGKEFPRVQPCECRGGPPSRPVPIVTEDMKLDAQSRAAGETD